LNTIRSAWRRLVKVVLMPDDVMGRSNLAHVASHVAPCMAAVQYAETGRARHK